MIDRPGGRPDAHESQKVAGTEDRVDPRLLELLVCPLTKTRLAYRAETHELISAAARLAFPIRDGVPLMIVDAARELGADERV